MPNGLGGIASVEGSYGASYTITVNKSEPNSLFNFTC
jgi:hypothetical protein